LEAEKKFTHMLELVTCGEKHGGAIISLVMMNEGKNLVSATADVCVFMGSWKKAGGNNMKSRSDLVVASGIGDGKRQGVRADDDMNKSVGSGTGLSGIRVYQISKGYSWHRGCLVGGSKR